MCPDTFIDTPDGPMAAIVAMPRSVGPFASAIILPHVGGLTRTMRIMAERAAEGGYLCVVPDLYHRLGTIVLDPQSNDENVLAIRRIAAGSLTGSGVMADVRAVLDWLSRQSLARPGPRGVIGYGKSGSFSLLAAGRFPEEIKAAVSVLGFGFIADDPNSPHRWFPNIRGELYCAFAEHDDIIPPSVPDALRTELVAHRLNAEFVVHPGTRHPYVFPDRTVYDKAAAEADWARIFALFARCLRPSQP